MRIAHRELLAAWRQLLCGGTPLLSIEVTRECPLQCPGCYAYADGHVGSHTRLRDMCEYRGDELVNRLLSVIDRQKPTHISFVGGEPLLRHRELSRVLPILDARGLHTLVVTSGVLPIPAGWMPLRRLIVCVSVDGLPRDHDVRRHPATYDRILRHLEGRRVYLHWTIVRSQAEQADYLEEYLRFWNPRPEVRRILVSLYTPQRGERTPEMLPAGMRARVAGQLHELSLRYVKLIAPQLLTDAFVAPPGNGARCVYALVSRNYTSDLATCLEPCILGGTPDCAQCGCAIGAALHGIAAVKLLGPLRVRHLIRASTSIASTVTRLRRVPDPARITRSLLSARPHSHRG